MLDETEVKRIVALTIYELQQRNILQGFEIAAYKEISNRLHSFFNLDVPDDDLQSALDKLKRDKYFHVLWMFYRDGYTVEEIAERLNVDVRTVSRNKKRLCLQIYETLYH